MSSKKILLVGELNPYGADPRHVLFNRPRGSAGHRLQQKILAIPSRTYLGDRIERANLCEGVWGARQARQTVARIRAEQCGDEFRDVIVLLGSKVVTAFKFGHDLSIHRVETVREEYHRGTCTFVACPHPSGRNRLWNDPTLVRRVREVLRELVPDVPWGVTDLG